MGRTYEIVPVTAIRPDLEEAMNAFTTLLEKKAKDGWMLRLESYQILYAQNNYIVSGLTYKEGR